MTQNELDVGFDFFPEVMTISVRVGYEGFGASEEVA